MADRRRRGTRPAVHLLLIGAVTLVPACGVHESRADCPATLRLLLGEVGAAYLTLRDAAGVLYRNSLPAGLDECVLELPRTQIFIELTEGGTLPLTIPPGEPCPPLRCFRDTLELPVGETVLPVLPLRQYALLTVEGTDGADLLVTGLVDGFDGDGRPSEGLFSTAVSIRGAPAVFRLPRQRDASLQLRVTLGRSSSDFALGEILQEAGYDWTAPDLAPCTMRLDLAATHIATDDQPWQRRDAWQVVL